MHDTTISQFKEASSVSYLLWIWDVARIGQDKSAELVKILDSPSPSEWRTEFLGQQRKSVRSYVSSGT